MIDVAPERFEQLVADALDTIPSGLAEHMDNVWVMVEEGWSPNLLGLYEGVPLTQRDAGYGGMIMPDRIKIFRKAICGICDTEEEVVAQVRQTVIHEVAHHFGIDDARLHELGWG